MSQPAPAEPTPNITPTPEYLPQWSEWTRRLAGVGLIIASVYALTLLAPVIQILVTAFLLAFLMYLPARFLARYTRLNFAGGVVVVYLLLLGLILLFIITFIPGFVNAVNALADDVQTRYADVRAYILAYEPGVDTVQVFGMQIALDPVIEPLKSLVQIGDPAPVDPLVQPTPTPINLNMLAQSSPINLGQAAPALSAFTSILTGAVSSIGAFSSSLFLALFLSFLILVELPSYQNSLMNAIPGPYKRETLLLMERIFELWIGFFRGQGIIAIIIGLLTWLQLQAMGIPQANILAVFTAFISLIPTIGGIIALIPLGLVPLLQGSAVLPFSNVTDALFVVLGNLIISQIIWNGVAPRILGNVVALPVPVIIVGVVIGAAVGGVLGAFLIVPILGTTRLVVLYILAKIARRDPFPGELPPLIEDLAEL